MKNCYVLIVLVCLLFVFGCGKKDIEKKVDSLIKAKDFDNAINLLDEKIREEPSIELYRRLKVKVYARSGNVEQAFKEYEKFFSMTNKANEDLLLELGLSPLMANVSPYKFMALLTLSEAKELNAHMKKLVIEAMSDADEAVRVASCWVSGRKKLKEAEERLIKLCSDSKNDVVWNAIWALGELKSEKGKNIIYDLVDRAKDPSVVLEAINAIGKYRDSSSLIKIKKFFNHPGKHISTSALAAAEYIEKGTIKETYDFVKAKNDKDLLNFLYLLAGEYKQKSMLPVIIDALKDKNTTGKENAIKALGDIGDEKTLHIVRPFTESKIQVERVHAYFAAYKLGEKEKQIFLKGLSDPSIEVRRISALMLARENNKQINLMLHEKLLRAPTLDKIYLSLAVSHKI